MKQPSVLEKRFADLWDILSGPELVREFRFHKGRQWKADFAHLGSRVLIEIEGGVWSRGRHVSPKGFLRDAEKYLTATLDGWTVIRLTSEQLTVDIARQIIEYVNQRTA